MASAAKPCFQIGAPKVAIGFILWGVGLGGCIGTSSEGQVSSLRDLPWLGPELGHLETRGQVSYVIRYGYRGSDMYVECQVAPAAAMAFFKHVGLRPEEAYGDGRLLRTLRRGLKENDVPVAVADTAIGGRVSWNGAQVDLFYFPRTGHFAVYALRTPDAVQEARRGGPATQALNERERAERTSSGSPRAP